MGKRRRIKILRAQIEAAEDKLDRKRRSVRKLKREVKRLTKILDRIDERDERRRDWREVKRAMKIRDSSLRDFIDALPTPIFSRVWNGIADRHHYCLWLQADVRLQIITREVMDEVACRWSKNDPIPILSKDTVTVRDDKPIIPWKNARHRNYAQRFLEFILSVFGPAGENRILKDFMQKLEDPNLNLSQFQNLYFHKFLQSREDITCFPVLAVHTLRRLGNVDFGGKFCYWTGAYRRWVRNHYPEGGIDLASTCIEDETAWTAFTYRFYLDDPIDEAALVRNLITHFNECKVRDAASSDLQQVGEVVFALFPDIVTDLFDFLYECCVNLDFTARRTFYSEPVAVAIG